MMLAGEGDSSACARAPQDVGLHQAGCRVVDRHAEVPDKSRPDKLAAVVVRALAVPTRLGASS
jgi:hypothetical protein